MIGQRGRRFQTSRVAKRRRKRLLLKFGAVVLVVVFLIGFFSWLSHRTEVSIANIFIEGSSVVSEEEILALVNEKLAGDYLKLFSKSNILLYPRRDIQATALNSFKRLESVELSFEDFRSISVTVQERKPHALWCEHVRGEDFEDETQDEQGRCYFLDERGLIFSKAPDFTGNVFFEYYGPIDEGEVIGQQFLTENEFRTISFFINSSRDSGLEPISLALSGSTDVELRLSDGSRIIFGREQDFDEVIENLQSVFESETFTEKEPLELDYIDLRFGNRVFYKFKN